MAGRVCKFSWTEFAAIVPHVCGVTLDSEIAGDPEREDPNQKDIVSAQASASLFVIAGPGSGKTTSATLRLLKLVFVDGVEPEAIFATTFTRKAAAELRSRIIEWGEGLRERLSAVHPERAEALDGLDLNKMMVGTLDSLAQEVLNDHKQAGDPRPAPVEPHILTTLMLTKGIFGSTISQSGQGEHEADAGNFLRQFFPREAPSDPGRASALVELRQRLLNDRIDRDALRKAKVGTPDGPGLDAVLDVIEDFDHFLQDAEIYDFSSINLVFLERLMAGELSDFTERLKFVLVDEYQDTNYLQESIYFCLAAAACGKGGSITVVGDDDQSLYRFRGATVELFAGFESRLEAAVGTRPSRVAINRSYRSTANIVKLVNMFADNDPKYQTARVAGKPALEHGKANLKTYPVFGLFRDSEQGVADAIARLTARLASGSTISIPGGDGMVHQLALNEKGSPGDIAVLTYSTNEYGERKQNGEPGRERFPFKLRQSLAAETPRIAIFNPRGCPLRDIPAVQELLGLVLLCLDPEGVALQRMRERSDEDGNISLRYGRIAGILESWRARAIDSLPHRDPALGKFVTDWGQRRSARVRNPTRVSLNDIIFKLIKWLPLFQTDIEHLAWLEAVQRAVSSSAVLQGFAGDVVFVAGNFDHELSLMSIRHAYQRVLFPIAEDVVEVSEDILETLPRDRVNIMTIHQSKGLEFPVTIVDIGTALQDGRWIKSRSRFPTEPDTAHELEDYFRPYSSIGLPERDGLDRAFDDLVRNYFVAFSRAQDVLVLAGHTRALRRAPRQTVLAHVGAGWCRKDENNPSGFWPWENMNHLVLIEEEHL